MLKALLSARGLRLVDVSAALGVDKATVTRWSQKKIPAERVLEIEQFSRIPRHELRPDLYPAPSQEDAA